MDTDNEDMIITVRMLMIGKEIGGIIGKAGTNIAKFRSESGARITISSEQSVPERIVTITGGRGQIHKAVELIAGKMHSDINSGLSNCATNTVPVTIRLIVPASQCGSIIGKGGVKIKEIRDTTGCAIQVQSEMLPNCSERTVTLSGAPSTILHCIDMLCDVMIQYPAKTATVPFKPDVGNPTCIFHQGKTYMLQGQNLLLESQEQQHLIFVAMLILNVCTLKRNIQMIFARSSGNHQYTDGNCNHFTMDAAEDIEDLPCHSVNIEANFPARLISCNTQELTVGNEFMGCIIGKGGSRIKEIRMLSGAQIQINKVEKEDESVDRKITIQGSAEAISLAYYLITLSVNMFSGDKWQTESMRGQRDFGPTGSLLGQPPATGVFGSVSVPFVGQGSPINEFNASMMAARRALLSSNKPRTQLTRNRPRVNSSSRSDTTDSDLNAKGELRSTSPNGKERRKTKREKFQPY
uniref:poly(rC)-binding protein 3 n=1 Tax=Ciona intestinalis TaxID=7719 RepID=UPI000EF4A0BF|nr:poly(rC)-binding protein 3 [Ciona intestinalis]|eukprot:XP_026695910.1 poly(rC)-binding protein 3 [Ciona intestinalis]